MKNEIIEKVIQGLECCVLRDPDDKRQCDNCPYRHPDGVITNSPCANGLMGNALSLLKAQEQEINRLKHCIDCDAAEKLPSGCVGYGRGFNDDEPCETCKSCEKYNGYGEE